MVQRIQFREEEMREAIAEFRRCAREMRSCVEQIHSLARSLDEGALIGQGGTAMSEALNRNMCGSIERLAQKMEERARFTETELEQLLRAASQMR